MTSGAPLLCFFPAGAVGTSWPKPFDPEFNKWPVLGRCPAKPLNLLGNTASL